MLVSYKDSITISFSMQATSYEGWEKIRENIKKIEKDGQRIPKVREKH